MGDKMVITLEPFSLTPYTRLSDLESFGKARFVIELKGNNIYSNPKVTSPILHETHGFQMFECLRLIIKLQRIGKGK